MTRKRWIQDEGGRLIPADEYRSPEPISAMIMPDIAPYQSMMDGSMITSRSKHREHLRAHNCTEIGDQVHHLKQYGRYGSPPGLKETVIREVHRAKEAQRNGRKYGTD